MWGRIRISRRISVSGVEFVLWVMPCLLGVWVLEGVTAVQLASIWNLTTSSYSLTSFTPVCFSTSGFSEHHLHRAHRIGNHSSRSIGINT